jgi:hypothetical protein
MYGTASDQQERGLQFLFTSWDLLEWCVDFWSVVGISWLGDTIGGLLHTYLAHSSFVYNFSTFFINIYFYVSYYILCR